MIKTILFDVDGTLIDTEQAILRSLKELLNEELHLIVPEAELTFVLGIPGEKALERYSDSPAERARLLTIWVEKLAAHSTDVRLFDGIVPLLTKLKNTGYQLGVVTSKLRNELIKEFASFELTDFFEVVVTASDTKKHKPNPEPILKALEELHARPEETIYIGDSVYDLRCAQNSQVVFALAGWGAQPAEEFSTLERILSQPNDLLAVL